MARHGRSGRLALPSLVAASIGVLASCTGGPAGQASPLPEIKLTTAAASDWQASDLAVRITPDAGGWSLSIHSLAERPATVLLLEAEFPSQFTATQVQRLVPQGELDLLVSDHPGVLALGVYMPAGRSIPPGDILYAKLRRSAGALRQSSKLPQGAAGAVPDLVGAENGTSGFDLSWGYYSTGDYDQNGEVNIADLTPIAGRFKQSAVDGDRDGLDRLLDGDGNTEINLADITPIASNFHNLVAGYRVFRADGPDPLTAASTQVAEIPFDGSTLPTDSRRLFHTTVQGTDLVAGAYYFVRPFEGGVGEEGSPSNVVHYLALAAMKFRLPPPGESVMDGQQCQNPSLVLLPGIPGLSEDGAPVVVYTTLGGGGTPLMLGHYGKDGWTTEDISGGHNFAMPKAALLPSTESDPGGGMLIAFDINGLTVVDRRFNDLWEQTSSQDVGGGSGAFSRLAFDCDPQSGGFGVAHAYTGTGTGSVQYSYAGPTGGWTTEPVWTGDTVGGLAFRFDPGGGAPWLLFTHGTFVTSPTLSIKFGLEQARRNGMTWTISPVPYPDSPTQVDLGFRTDGTPQLVCTAARDYTISIPLLDPITISLLFDVATAEYGGTSWSFKRAYESTFGFSLGGGLPPTTLVLDLDFASEAGWAQPDEMLYSRAAGTVDVDLQTQLPTGAALTGTSLYMQRGGGGTYGESGYYDGSPGRAYSWAVNSQGQPTCAYVRGTSISAQNVLNGNFAAAGELAFWRP